MSLPDKYKPLNVFQSLDNEIGVQLDRNFAAIARNISQLVDVLAVLARDDSRLANATVHIQALTADLYRFIQGQNGNWKLKGNWQGGRYYDYADIIQYNNTAYGCCVAHQANQDFAYDLNQGYWQILTGGVGDSPSLNYVDTAIAAAKADALNTVASIYLTASNAASTYITNAQANSLFLTIANAANTYLTLSGAASIYATIASLNAYAPKNSPTFTGIPRAPSPTIGDFSDKIATTEFVQLNSDSVGNIQVFTASGTFTVPAGVRKCRVTVVGGGGGGGGAGGSGFFGNAGGGGGTSSFGSYCSATGGGGGGGGGNAASIPSGSPGLGGSGSSGAINLSGSKGQWGVMGTTPTTSDGTGSMGGSSYFSIGGYGGDSLAGGNGGGGSGGGSGGAAIKIITGLTDGQSISVTVGAAGGGGAANPGGGAGVAGAGGLVIVEY